MADFFTVELEIFGERLTRAQALKGGPATEVQGQGLAIGGAEGLNHKGQAV